MSVCKNKGKKDCLGCDADSYGDTRLMCFYSNNSSESLCTTDEEDVMEQSDETYYSDLASYCYGGCYPWIEGF